MLNILSISLFLSTPAAPAGAAALSGFASRFDAVLLPRPVGRGRRIGD